MCSISLSLKFYYKVLKYYLYYLVLDIDIDNYLYYLVGMIGIYLVLDIDNYLDYLVGMIGIFKNLSMYVFCQSIKKIFNV